VTEAERRAALDEARNNPRRVEDIDTSRRLLALADVVAETLVEIRAKLDEAVMRGRVLEASNFETPAAIELRARLEAFVAEAEALAETIRGVGK
jgi:hypothetical protein